MKIHTENSVYEFNKENRTVRRLANPIDNPFRKDGDWMKYVAFHAEVGEPMHLVTAHEGGDPSALTMKTTSVVLKVEE